MKSSLRASRFTLVLAAGLLAAAAATPAAAKDVLKLATLAPQGSVWDNALREMGARWTKESAGAVELRIYPGGVAGDEADVVRKIRIGQFQGAALTVTGLAEIDSAFAAFEIPMLFESWDEVDRVLAKLRPELERRLAEKGYVLLLWGHGGWVHLFSRQPIRGVDDLKKQKLFVWAGDDAQVQQWRKNGFQPVALAATDVAMGFQTRMIDVLPTTPDRGPDAAVVPPDALHDESRRGAADRRRRRHSSTPGRRSRPPSARSSCPPSARRRRPWRARFRSRTPTPSGR